MLMRRYLAVLLSAAFILATCSATDELKKTTSLQISTPEIEPAPRELAADQNSKKRLLRVHEKPLSGNNNLDEEERTFGITRLMKALEKRKQEKLARIAKRKQYDQWLDAGENPKTIHEKLGLKGRAAGLKDDPKFHDYLAFSDLWRRKKGMYIVPR